MIFFWAFFQKMFLYFFESPWGYRSLVPPWGHALSSWVRPHIAVRKTRLVWLLCHGELIGNEIRCCSNNSDTFLQPTVKLYSNTNKQMASRRGLSQLRAPKEFKIPLRGHQAKKEYLWEGLKLHTILSSHIHRFNTTCHFNSIRRFDSIEIADSATLR